MQSTKWYNDILEKLESVKENIEPTDFRFYNIKHLPLIAKYTLDYSKSCPKCTDNISIINEIVVFLEDFSGKSNSKRRIFERKKNKIEDHLKKNHHLRFPGYYTSLGTFLGLLAAIFLSAILSFILHIAPFNNLLLISIAFGVIIGRIVGNILDRNIYINKKQM